MTWRQFAACRDEHELMFDPARVDLALRLCEGCPVVAACDAYVAVVRPMAGVWAGSIREPKGQALRRASRRSQSVS